MSAPRKPGPMVDAAVVVDQMERRYLEFVAAAGNAGPEADYWRWNGAAEAIRDSVTMVRDLAGMSPVNMRDGVWRSAKERGAL